MKGNPMKLLPTKALQFLRRRKQSRRGTELPAETAEAVPEPVIWELMLRQAQKKRNGTVFRILILRTGIAGLGKRMQQYGNYGHTLVDMIHPGERLFLQREPDNEYDRFAVSVHTGAKLKLGYLPRYKNETAARLMDSGFRIAAYVDSPPELDIAYSPTEDFRLPISIYLIL